jgi:hypothetical protein
MLLDDSFCIRLDNWILVLKMVRFPYLHKSLWLLLRMIHNRPLAQNLLCICWILNFCKKVWKTARIEQSLFYCYLIVCLDLNLRFLALSKSQIFQYYWEIKTIFFILRPLRKTNLLYNLLFFLMALLWEH